MAKATLTISSKNYSSWALRAWLLCKMAGLEFKEKIVPPDDPSMRAAPIVAIVSGSTAQA